MKGKTTTIFVFLIFLFRNTIADNNDLTLDVGYSFKESDCTKTDLKISMSLEYRESTQGAPSATECTTDSASTTYEFEAKSYQCNGLVQFQRSGDITFYDNANGTFVPGQFNFTSVQANGTVNIYVRNGDFTGVCDLGLTQGACTWCFGESECQSSICTYGITVRVFEPFWGSTLGIVTIACIVAGCVCLSVALSICCYCCLCRDKDDVYSNKKKKKKKDPKKVPPTSKSSTKLTSSVDEEKGQDSIDLEVKGEGQYSPIPVKSPNRASSTTQIKQSSTGSISKATPTFINKDYSDMPSKDYIDSKQQSPQQQNKNTINNRGSINTNKNTINNRNTTSIAVQQPEGYSNVPQVLSLSGKEQDWVDVNSNAPNTEYSDMLATNQRLEYGSSIQSQSPDEYGSMPSPVQSNTYGTMPPSSHATDSSQYGVMPNPPSSSHQSAQYGVMPNPPSSITSHQSAQYGAMPPPVSQSSQYGVMPPPPSSSSQSSQYGAMPTPQYSTNSSLEYGEMPKKQEYGQMPTIPNRN